MRLRACFALPLFAVVSCSSHAEAPSADAAEVVATGRDCARASIACEPGRCTAEVHNRCTTPVTCQLRVESSCQTSGGEGGPANASSKHVTQLAGTKRVLDVATSCGQGSPVVTRVQSISCI